MFPDPPVITLSLGSNLDETDIKEGDDVYFECDVTSHPEAYKVTWRRNVRAGERERQTERESLGFAYLGRNSGNNLWYTPAEDLPFKESGLIANYTLHNS